MAIRIDVGDVTQIDCDAILTLVDAVNRDWDGPTDVALSLCTIGRPGYYYDELRWRLDHEPGADVVAVTYGDLPAVVFSVVQFESGVVGSQFLRRGLVEASRLGYCRVAVAVESRNYEGLDDGALDEAIGMVIGPVVDELRDPRSNITTVTLMIDNENLPLMNEFCRVLERVLGGAF